MTKIFIAGAAGNIGTALLAELHDKDVNVVAGVHSADKAKTLSDLGTDARAFDYTDAESMTAAMQGCDSMFLVLPFAEHFTRFGHLAVEAAKEAGIEYIVRSSGYAASSDAHWKLGREHGMVDQFIEDSGIPFTVLRPNNFMQNFTTHYLGMIKGGTIMIPEEDSAISYLDVRDIASCAATLFLDNTEHQNKFYALTGPNALTLSEVAASISEASGRDVQYAPLDEDTYIAGLNEQGVPEWNVTMLTSLSRIIKRGMASNVTKAVEYLTGNPARSFAAFVQEHAQLWK